ISWLIIGVIVVLYPPFYKESLVFACTAFMLLGNMLFPDWFFQGMEKMKYIAFLNVGIKVFFTVFVFVIITKPDEYWKYALLNSIGYLGAGLVGQYLLVKKYKLHFIWLKRKVVKQTIIDNYPIFVN